MPTAETLKKHPLARYSFSADRQSKVKYTTFLEKVGQEKGMGGIVVKVSEDSKHPLTQKIVTKLADNLETLEFYHEFSELEGAEMF